MLPKYKIGINIETPLALKKKICLAVKHLYMLHTSIISYAHSAETLAGQLLKI